MAGIYIHIPFCKQACHYCNFHFSTSLKYKEEMIAMICKEIKLQKDFLSEKVLESIYFGGGTPSLLERRDLELIFDSIFSHYDLEENAEITLEANPDDLNLEKIKMLKSSLVNRLSIGIQSFFDDELQFFNRAHTSSEAIKSLDLAKNAEFMLNCDLIYGSPLSSLEKIEKNLHHLLEYYPEHISTYALTVEEKTAYAYQIKKGHAAAPNDKETSLQYDLIMEALGSRGYDHYEISNFSLPSCHAIHNTNYWLGREYLGVGPSSHSYRNNQRQWNISHNQHYMEALGRSEIPATVEDLSKDDRYNEYIMTSLRTSWGVSKAHLQTMGSPYYESFMSQLEKIDPEWISNNPAAVVLTRKGKHFADRVAMELFI